jgi:hypothetical protein
VGRQAALAFGCAILYKRGFVAIAPGSAITMQTRS